MVMGAADESSRGKVLRGGHACITVYSGRWGAIQSSSFCLSFPFPTCWYGLYVAATSTSSRETRSEQPSHVKSFLRETGLAFGGSEWKHITFFLMRFHDMVAFSLHGLGGNMYSSPLSFPFRKKGWWAMRVGIQGFLSLKTVASFFDSERRLGVCSDLV